MGLKKFHLAVIFILVLLLAACGNSSTSSNENAGAGDQYVLKLSHAYPTSSFVHTFMEWFNEEVQKRSDGRLAIDIYPNGQLMPPDQEMPAILQGQIDMTHTLSPVLAGFDPIWNFYELPFIFDYDPNDPTVFIENRMKFNKNENGGQKIIKMMEDKGLKVLSLGFVDMFGSIYTADKDKLVTVPESAAGLKLRTPGGIIGPETAKAIGASGITISGTEVITALQQKVVDGLLTTPIYADDAKLPIESLTVVPLFNTVTPLIISQDEFDSLPADLQEILIETGKDLEEYGKQQVLEKAETAFSTLEEKGVEIYYPTAEEIEQWKAATQPARDVFVKQVDGGEDLLKVLSEME